MGEKILFTIYTILFIDNVVWQRGGVSVEPPWLQAATTIKMKKTGQYWT